MFLSFRQKLGIGQSAQRSSMGYWRVYSTDGCDLCHQRPPELVFCNCINS